MIRVQVLGHLSLEARDAPVHALAAQPLRGSVFLYLCVEREASRETLVRMFWPDREEDKARRLLSQTLYELKRLFGEDWFAGAGEVIRLEGVTVDVHLFEGALGKGELDRALAFYQGAFLSDFQRFDSAEFNAWVDRKKAHYERLHRRARRERIKKLLEEGDRNAALSVAQRWSELDPLEDEAQQRAIELLHEMGRRTEALQTYDTYVARLKEVDLVPLDEMRALAKRIREGAAPALPAATVAVKAPERIDTEPRASSARSDATPSTLPPEGRRNPRVKALAAAFVLTLIIVLGFTIDAMRNDVRTAAVPIEAGYDLSRVAVLYFDDNSAGGKLDYLAKGLTEALIDELLKVEALNVVSRNGVKPYRDSQVALDSVARALGVGTIVEGSLQDAGDNIRVSVNLVDARTGMSLHNRTISVRAGASYMLEDAVIKEVAAFLRDRLGRELEVQRVRRGASNEEAYRLYQIADGYRERILGGRVHQRLADPGTYELLTRSADSLLLKAEKLDPRWSAPKLLRGWLAADRGALTSMPGSKESDRHLQLTVDIATQVIRKEPGNALAHELRGLAFSRLAANALGASADSLHAAAERDLERTVQIDGSRAAAWNWLSQLRQLSADFERAALYANQALDADEFMLERQEIVHRLVRIDTDRERFPQAASQCRKGRQEFPDSPRFVECQLILAILDPASRISTDSANRLFKTLREMTQPDPAWKSYQSVFRETLRARIWARNGRPDSALAILDRMKAIVKRDSLMPVAFPFDAGHVLLVAGDSAGALREAQKYVDLNPRYLKYVKEGVAFKSIAQHIHD